MLRFILCDDNKEQLELLEANTTQWTGEHGLEVELVIFNSAVELLEQYAPRHEDIVILDILMPDINGLELAKRLRSSNIDFSLIFLTSSKDFA